MTEPTASLPQDLRAELERVRLRSPESLRDEVERLVREHPRRRVALTSWFASVAEAAAGATSATGAERIGPYCLLHRLGEGGMGTVYLAEQIEPVRRRVALKLVKAGMDSAAILRRFEHERQALARMRHDGIARIFDCGTSERGQPYFVMELVEGAPLTEFADAEQLTVEERLRLFQQVCAAVTHAHQKGVVHRDLKPGNVLVERRDGVATAKVIDFGLAKAIGGDGESGALQTVVGNVLGTPEYMAPEQARCDHADIDTRADVYSLGVMLYELLVGQLPLVLDERQRRSPSELVQVLAEVEPRSPSARLASDPAAARIAHARRTTTASLRRRLQPDLDWIVLQAIAKDRDRRYQSAAALAEDVQRYLDHEPVQAGPPSRLYRLRKLVRRHRLPLVAGGLIVLTLGATAVVWAAERARSGVLQRENLELRAGERFRGAILWEWLDATVGGHARRTVGRDRTRRELGDLVAFAPTFAPGVRLLEVLEAEAEGRPLTLATAGPTDVVGRFLTARSLARQRQFDAAMPLLELLAGDSLFGASALMHQAVLLTTGGRTEFDLAVQRLQQAAASCPRHPVILCNLASCYFQMQPRARTAQWFGGQLRDLDGRLKEAGAEHPDRGELLLARAWVKMVMGGPDETDTVRDLLEQAAARTDDVPAFFANLGEAYINTAGRITDPARDEEVVCRLQQAKAAFQRALELAPDPDYHCGLATALLGLRENELAAYHARLALQSSTAEMRQRARTVLDRLK